MKPGNAACTCRRQHGCHSRLNLNFFCEMTTVLFKFVKLLKTEVVPKVNSAITTSFSKKYLLYTNVGVSLTLSGVGDIIEQHYEILTGEMDEWDKIRTKNMSIYGMTMGAFCHHWYNYLDRVLPGHTLRIVLRKILVDQLVCSPICITWLFVISGLLEKKTRGEILNEIKQKGPILYAAEWVVWPPAQFINFYILPTRFRVVYDNTISLGYDIYTSCIKHGKTEPEEETK